MVRSRITGTGVYLPSRILTNKDLEKTVDTTDQWITERTGIKERRIAADEESTSDLAFEAAKNALKDARLKARDIDMILVATMTSDMNLPSTACIVQRMLGAKNAVAFDLNAACSGFIFGLATADSFIRSGQRERVLVIGAEVLSRFLDWKDRSTCVLFGDAAGAVVVEKTRDDCGIVSVDIHSDGAYWDLLTIPAGGSRIPASKESVRKGLHSIKMKGNETFKVAVRTLEGLVKDALDRNHLSADQLTLLIPHQANLRIINAIADRLKLPREKILVNLDRLGNTSAASVPVALHEALQAGRIRAGDYVLLEAFGGGLTWGSVLLKW